MEATFPNQKYINLMKLFIICQPILDILTYLAITYFEVTITPGIIVRVLFMGITFIYIFFMNKNSYGKKIMIYLLILLTIVGLSFIMNFFLKPNFYFLQEVQYFVKALYFPTMFCGMLLTFSYDFDNRINLNILSPITIAMLIFSLSMFIAILTGTSSTTYMVRSGYSGWFYAGNEISAIAGICFPLVLIYSIFKTTTTNNYLYWIPSLLLLIAAFLIGTKVGFLAMLLTIIVVLVFSVFGWLFHLNKGILKNPYNKALLTSIALVIFFIAMTPLAPAVKNVLSDYENTEETTTPSAPSESTTEDVQPAEESTSEQPSTEDEGILDNFPLLTYVLSYRDVYFLNTYEDYKEADTIHKWFGMGYAGFYEEKPKLVEMDFFDIFFSFGIVGSIIYFLPIFYVIYIVIKTLFRNANEFFKIENILLVVSCCLGFGIALLAGHVLYAPGVSIYLSLSLVLLINYHSGKFSKV